MHEIAEKLDEARAALANVPTAGADLAINPIWTRYAVMLLELLIRILQDQQPK